MKTILLSLYLLSLTTLCSSQQVLLFGTTHHFKNEFIDLQDFKLTQNNLVNFQPDIICIESIPTYDTASLKEIWASSMNRADSLTWALAKGEYQNTASPQQLKGAHLWASYDFWNAYYYWDSLAVNQSPGPFAKYHRKLDNSEYGNIVFPIARTLKIESFYNIDYRAKESTFLANQNKALKQLLFRLKWKPLKTYLKLQKSYRKAEEKGELITFINSTEFQNSFSQLIEDLPLLLKKSEEAQFVKTYWNSRNKTMAGRIDQAAKVSHAEKILVTVGSAHVNHIKHYLELLNYDVLTYGEYSQKRQQN